MSLQRTLLGLCFLATLAWLAGCQTEERPTAPLVPAKPFVGTPSGGRLATPVRPISREDWKQEIDQWRGTPYQKGGLTRGGVDCSGLVFQVYRSVGGLTLPRTAQLQYRLGLEVPANALKPGDLVFFALSSPEMDHVGIALGGEQFAHASTKKGVMISSLRDRYYASHFYGAKRLLQN